MICSVRLRSPTHWSCTNAPLYRSSAVGFPRKACWQSPSSNQPVQRSCSAGSLTPGCAALLTRFTASWASCLIRFFGAVGKFGIGRRAYYETSPLTGLNPASISRPTSKQRTWSMIWASSHDFPKTSRFICLLGGTPVSAGIVLGTSRSSGSWPGSLRRNYV